MPRVSVAEWRHLSLLNRWLVASRAAVLVMTFNAAAIGGLLAWQDGAFEPLRWGLCVIGLLLAHATNNQLNDLVDSERGIDGGNYFRNRYGTHVLEDGLLSRRQLITYIVGTGILALAAGVALVVLSGPAVLVPLALGAVFLLFYTHPFKQWGLGEMAVLLVWGPLMIGGTYLAVTGSWSHEAALIGLLCALGPTAVIFGKHIDKLAPDREKGVFTLPVRLGEAPSRAVTVSFVWLQVLGTVAAVAGGWLPWPTLITLVALPQAVVLTKVYQQPPPATPPADYPAGVWPLWYVAQAFSFTRSFGLLFLLGLAIGTAL
jgi:1,4-dihydroxy-2-naphthoate octaprenyltransferase